MLFSLVDLGRSPLNTQNSESATAQYHHSSMESASPSSSGKMMPSGGKNGKPSSMSGLVRTGSSQQPHPAYYNGGKGNPAAGGYPMMMTHSQQSSQQWISSPQQIRYPSHGGKPMGYNQQRMSYSGDPYIMRQPTPQGPSSSYPYPSNIGKLIKLEKLFRRYLVFF